MPPYYPVAPKLLAALLVQGVYEAGIETSLTERAGWGIGGDWGLGWGECWGVVVYNAGVGAGRVLCFAGGVALVSGCLLDDGGVSGVGLRRAFGLGLARLEERRDAVNALNVFPVPDGDTGTNMSLTLRAGIEGCPEGDDGVGAGVAARGLADGAFFGARGNSGVILSQFLRGFAVGLEGCEVCRAGDWARGLDAAREAAYGAVGTPREGTMLTVMRRAAGAALAAGAAGGDLAGAAAAGYPAVGAAGGGGDLGGTTAGYPAGGAGEDGDLGGAMAAGYLAACAALRDTPEQLAALKEAGVVDSGGLGVVVILGGVLEALFPERFGALSDVAGVQGIIDASMASLGGAAAQGEGYLHQTLEADWGYCTEFMISGEGLSLGEVRRYYEATARSTVVAGDSRQVRVHIHAEDPGPAISHGAALGTLSRVKIESMDDQNAEWAASHRSRAGDGADGADDGAAAVVDLAVVAVAAGDGLAGVFMGSGCGYVIEGGQTMNPSVGDIVAGVRRAGARDTIVLPNNKNILLTAEQAAAGDTGVHIVASRSVPQGVAALLAYNPLWGLEDNLAAMAGAVSGVVTIEVTRAVRDSSVDGVSVRQGDYIALVDDRLALSAGSAEGALAGAIALAGPGGDAVVTVYRGADADGAAAESCAAALGAGFPGVEVEWVYGGQPHYHYLASVE